MYTRPRNWTRVASLGGEIANHYTSGAGWSSNSTDQKKSLNTEEWQPANKNCNSLCQSEFCNKRIDNQIKGLIMARMRNSECLWISLEYILLAGVPGVARVNRVRENCNLIPPRHSMCLPSLSPPSPLLPSPFQLPHCNPPHLPLPVAPIPITPLPLPLPVSLSLSPPPHLPLSVASSPSLPLSFMSTLHTSPFTHPCLSLPITPSLNLPLLIAPL